MNSFAGNATGSQNEILAALPPGDFDLLALHLLRVQFVRDQVLVGYNQPVDHLLFVEHGVASVDSQPVEREPATQAAMIGREGIVGDLSLFDLRHSANVQVVAYIPGTALRLAGDTIGQALDGIPALQDACTRFAQSLVAQIVLGAACSVQLSLTERCARWIAMTRDRIDEDEISVTHDALSVMLGIRRSGIAFATAALQESGLIRTGRGRLTVLDRAGLGRAARGTALRAGLPGLGAVGTPPRKTLHTSKNGSGADKC